MKFRDAYPMIISGLLSLTPCASLAASAFAVGMGEHGATYAINANSETRPDAEAHALNACKTAPDAAAETRALCKIVDHFDNRCIAIAIDPKAGTPGWGWAIAEDSNIAQRRAVDMCRKSAGPDRALYCVVTDHACDGRARDPGMTQG